MRNQHVGRAMRVALFAVLLSSLTLGISACQDPTPEAPKDAVGDFALGVDGDFGVQTFALGAPTFAFSKPTTTDFYYLTAGANNVIPGTPCAVGKCQGTGDSCTVASDCSPYVQVVTQNITLGTGVVEMHCRVDGGSTVYKSKTGKPDIIEIPSIRTTQGLATIECVLVDCNSGACSNGGSGTELTNPEARGHRATYVVYDPFDSASPKCNTDLDCADGNNCSAEQCKAGKCSYTALALCCTDDWFCNPGENCLNPNLADPSKPSKCSACQADVDCDDAISCTFDKCDLSGNKGLCVHEKPDNVCCSSTDKCDDGKPCTIDSCDVANGVCKHVQPPNSCCADSECVSPDPCKIGGCSALQCHYAVNGDRKDCCSATTNNNCDDKSICTIDVCITPVTDATGSWTKCAHTADPSKPSCCKDNSDPKVSDGDGCTTDTCVSNIIFHTPVQECCASAIDCNDNNICTVDSCPVKPGETTAACEHDKTAECCTTQSDCNDQKFCTTDTCNVPTNHCMHVDLNPPGKCCDEDSQCSDGKFCTLDVCVNHSCLFIPDGSKPDCCEDPGAACSDGKHCTIDTCDVANKNCLHVANGDPTCCEDATWCDDKNCNTIDVCSADFHCVNKANPNTCSVAADCDDINPCTTDSCDTSGGCGVCKHDFNVDGCCGPVNDLKCNDGNACTADSCDQTNHKCAHADIPECCMDDQDALIKCDDTNSCTTDFCFNHSCHHTLPKNGCCKSNQDCYDGNKCTADICDTAQPQGDHFLCKFESVGPTCLDCTPEATVAGLDCNDNNKCTADYCDAAQHCHNSPIKECCVDKFDCDDGNACTYDQCTEQSSCIHLDNLSGQLLCCKAGSQDQDCAYLNTECQKGICQDAGKGNGETKCVVQEQPVCTVNIGYCQPFSGAATLHGMGWNPMFADGSDTSNWNLATAGHLGPDQYANFTWTPTKTQYGTCLQSPVIQAAGAKTITIQYDHEFVWNANSTQVKVLGSLDGSNANWATATVIEATTLTNNLGPETVDVTLPTILTGSNGLRLAFCLEGESTFDVTSFSLDNICIVKGGKPSMVACPVNQIVPFNTKKTIPLKAKDPDFGDILTFQVLEGPSFVTLSSALYFWLDKSWNTTLTINPTSLADVGSHKVRLKVTDGALYSVCTFNITVSYNGGYLIVRAPEVPTVMGDIWYNALHTLAPGKVIQHIDNLSLYTNLTQFEAVFLLLGVYPDNHVLTDSEATVFQNYLAKSGKLYMEGGDTWAYDPPTALHGSFKINGLADSVDEGIAPELQGQSIYTDLTQKTNGAAKSYSFGFLFSDAYNNNNDAISAKTGVHRTQNLLKSLGIIAKPWVQVGHDDDTGYRTVGSAIPYAGVVPGPVSNDQPIDMAKRITNFFTNGFVDCLDAGDCQDVDQCTTAQCTKGECIYTSTCTCKPVTQLNCGDTVTITTSKGDTQSAKALKVYGCDPNNQFFGYEKTYSFATTSSRPVTLTVSGMTNNDSKVFVVRGELGKCNPLECIVEMGQGTSKFAGAKNGEYYLSLDTPTEDVGAQATIHVECGDAEICTDGIDNNGNGLADCKDLESCCGDAACAEICDGLDNNCDGKIDEGCDMDGDGFCAAGLTVVGNPPICPGGGNDCDDTNGNISPGAPEQCGNSIDDNCNAFTDEAGGTGCTNLWLDGDKDGYGGGNPSCLCGASNTYIATKGGDCDDANKKVNPGLVEICGNGVDDDCSGSQNDPNAQGCTDYFNDSDGDGSGTLTKKCLCLTQGTFTAPLSGDCNDSDKFVFPGATEICNNVDDNCNSFLDEGCDDDLDGYCDATMGYVSIGVTSKQCGNGVEGSLVTVACESGRTITSIDFASFGNPIGFCGNYKVGSCYSPSTLQAVKTACLGKAQCTINVTSSLLGDGCAGQPKYLDLQVTCMGSGGTPPGVCTNGPGDTNDNDPSINPAGKEICDNIDNNSDGLVDEGCDDDADGFCDTAMIVIGAPLVCPAGGGDCNDGDLKVNPGVQEDCATVVDDDCDGSLNNQDALNCTVFFSDSDSDGYGTKSFKCFCNAVGSFKAKKTADCQDTNPAINPGVLEQCNGIDDDCDGVTDNGCDDDGDGYCEIGLTITSGTTACPNGAGDCDDTNFDINPGKAEICGDGIDNNCNGSQNDTGALLCTTFYADVDKDGYGSSNTRCQCAGAGNFTASVGGDCNDADAAINPTAQEICDDKDNNCSAGTDENCDKDLDGYCDATKQLVGSPAICPNGGSDCNDTNGNVHPNLAQEVCDNVDDDCNGVTDNGCDKDLDHYCDAGYAVIAPTPPVCSGGVNDCDDYDNTVHPGAPEICGNNKDDNCDGSQNDQGAVGCSTFYFDGDSDTYGLNASKCLCASAGSYKALTGDDCDDTKAAVHPNQNEDCATAFDDNCNVDTNDENATGCTNRAFDADNDGYGITGLTKCYCVAANSYSALTTNPADCNDTNAAVNPGASEKCNDIDDNCKLGVDEGCDDDGDKFCDGTMSTVGFPNVCPKGGSSTPGGANGDCDDTKANVNPGQPEVCDGFDNNCSGAGGTPSSSTLLISGSYGGPATFNCWGANGNGQAGLPPGNPTTFQTPTAVASLGGVPTSASGSYHYCAVVNGGVKCWGRNDAGQLGNGANTDNGTPQDVVGLTSGVKSVSVGAFHSCAVLLDGSVRCWGHNGNYQLGDGTVTNHNTPITPNGLTSGVAAVGAGLNHTCVAMTDGTAKCWGVNGSGQVGDGTTTNRSSPVTVTGLSGVTGISGGYDFECALTSAGAVKCWGNTWLGTPNVLTATTIVASGATAVMCGEHSTCAVVNGGAQCWGNQEGVGNLGNGSNTNSATPVNVTGLSSGVSAIYSGSTSDVFCAVLSTGAMTCWGNNSNDALLGNGTGNPGSSTVPTSSLFTSGVTLVAPGNQTNCAVAAASGTPINASLSTRNAAQTFTATVSGSLTGLDAYLTGSTNPAPVTVTIYSVTGSTLSAIGSATSTPPLVSSGSTKWTTTFTTPPTVVAGLTYAVAFTAGGTTTLSFENGNALYASGEAQYQLPPFNGAMTAYTGVDLHLSFSFLYTSGGSGIDEGCDDDNDHYCDSAMVTIGTPPRCILGGGDCDDTKVAVNPGQTESCGTTWDDNCNGSTNDINANGCAAFGVDMDGDTYSDKNKPTTCYCVPTGTNTGTNPGDCDDLNNLVHPGLPELCDGKDNNCNGVIDEGCDDDNDHWCDSSMTTIGKPPICTNGGGDCNDTATGGNINPGVNENCATANVDDNCSGGTNDNGATGCTTYYLDFDTDTWAVNVSQCTCIAAGKYTVTNVASLGDCDDNNANVNPGKTEVCGDSIDNNCNGSQNDTGANGCTLFYVDGDKDGYGPVSGGSNCQCFAAGTYVSSIGGDCNDANAKVNPGQGELCDNLDNNCNGSGGSGVIDSIAPLTTGYFAGGGSNYVSQTWVASTTGQLTAMTIGFNRNTAPTTWKPDIYFITGPLTSSWISAPNLVASATLPAGDTVASFTPGSTINITAGSTYTILIDAPPSGSVNIRVNNTNVYVPGVASNSTIGQILSGTATAIAPATDVMMTFTVLPPATGIDEGCDDDGDKYCDATMTLVGTSQPSCILGGGDCNDVAVSGVNIHPNQPEICDNVDQNCSGITDEGCDDDKDSFCDKAFTVVYAANNVCPQTTNAATLDCDDTQATVNPSKVEICDGLDNNCNGTTDEGCDKDGDTYCDVNMQTVGKPAACINGGGDCNDTAGSGGAINPGATELCDGVDNNCVAGTDEVCKDSDSDGYCVGAVTGSPPACPAGGNDCNDANGNVHPGQPENCATQYDDNCDGNTNPTTNIINFTKFYTDGDGDGFGVGAGQNSCYQIGTFTALINTDCDDTKATINPSALEICDAIDNNCKLGVDEGCDDDGDLYCDANMLIGSTATCTKTLPKPAAGTTKSGDDCNDVVISGANINPGITEVCNNIDDNCAAGIDEGCDDDKDGYCDSGMTVSVVSPAVCPATTVTGLGNDCNDLNAQVNPAQAENCKTAYDDNCDGSTTAPNANGCTVYFLDNDNDGYGQTGSTACNCTAAVSAPFYRALQGGDCNDANGLIFPGATEICDNKDNNCDAFAKIDEGCDDDKDGYCASGKSVTLNTNCPNTLGAVGDDCDSTNKLINPGAIEICDGQDNNCTAGTDENCNKDGDAYCDAAKVTVGTPGVCLSGGGDCNDTPVTGTNINPGSPEICDNKDNNCNGLTDDNPTNGTLFYFDGDQDGEPVNSNKVLCAASGFWSYSVAVKGNPSVFDCDDVGTTCGANCNHTLTENRCDGYDNNCNGTPDENCNKDGDGYCDSALTTIKNSSNNWPTVCTLGGGDCDDTSATGPNFNPGKTELCDNKDNNCNGQTDEQASVSCQIYPNAIGVCSGGVCAQAGCQTGYIDSNLGIAGCECYAVDQYEPNDSCGAATNLGTLTDNTNGVSAGQFVSVQALVADTNDHDWFTWYGSDYGDGNGACDRYNVRAVFTIGVPNVVFDIYRGGCPGASPSVAYAPGGTQYPVVGSTPGWNQVCCAQQDFNWFTYFKDWNVGRSPTSRYSEYGECPCSAGDTFIADFPANVGNLSYASPEWGPVGQLRGPWSGWSAYYDPNSVWGGYIPGGWGYTKCVDDSAQYYMHVYRTSGVQCSQYRVEVSNGVYGGTGSGGGWGYQLGKNW